MGCNDQYFAAVYLSDQGIGQDNPLYPPRMIPIG